MYLRCTLLITRTAETKLVLRWQTESQLYGTRRLDYYSVHVIVVQQLCADFYNLVHCYKTTNSKFSVLTYPAEVTVHSLTHFEFHSEVEAVVY